MKPSIHLLALLVATFSSISEVSQAVHLDLAEFNYSDLKAWNCGKLSVIPSDPRTSAPWHAVIFYRSSDSSPWKFFTTGAILGPTTILTVAPGRLGGPLRGSSEEDKLYPASSFLVGVGLNATDYNARDGFSQFSEVHFLEPYLEHIDENRHYHLLLYHLKTLLNLKTPYARAPCLIPAVAYELFTDSYFTLPFAWSGFVVSKSLMNATTSGSGPQKPFQLKHEQIPSVIRERCDKATRFHYGDIHPRNPLCASKEGIDPFTGNATKHVGDVSTIGGGSCYLHGSLALVSQSERFSLVGIVALIPARRKHRCDDKALYVLAEVSHCYDWLLNSVACSPNKYWCGSGNGSTNGASGACVPISKVCNGVADCSNGQDEDEQLCYAQNRCDQTGTGLGPEAEAGHFCGVTDTCISSKKVCDLVLDCESGADEHEERCVKSTAISDQAGTCSPPATSEGVRATCSNDEEAEGGPCRENLEAGQKVKLQCDSLYSPTYEAESVEFRCLPNGKFERVPPFACSPVCGLYKPWMSSNISSEKPLRRNLPWNALVFTYSDENPRSESDLDPALRACSATLIDPSFILTSTQCAQSGHLSGVFLEPLTTSLFVESRLVLNSTTEFDAQFEVTTQLLNYEKHWSQADLAIVKVKERAVKDANGRGFSPCFLSNPKLYSKAPLSNTVGWFIRYLPLVDGGQGDAVLGRAFAAKGRVVAPKACEEVHDGVRRNASRQLFCVMLESGDMRPEETEVNIGAGFLTRQRYKNANKFQYSLRGISVTRALPSPKSTGTSRLFQWFTSIEPFTDWITQTLESNY